MTSAKCAMITLSSFKWSLNIAIDKMQILVPSFQASPVDLNLASAKRSQHISTTYPNIVGPTFVSSDLTIATLFNVGATCCARLATLLRHVRTSAHARVQHIVARTLLNGNIHKCQLYEKFDQFQIWANNTQHVATSRNTSQQDGQTRATCWAQQCCDMLRWNVAIVWSGL